MNFIEKERMKNMKIASLSRKVSALRRRLLRKGVTPRENYGQKQLRKLDDDIQRTFTKYDINPYTTPKAKEMMIKVEKLEEDVANFTFPR